MQLNRVNMSVDHVSIECQIVCMQTTQGGQRCTVPDRCTGISRLTIVSREAKKKQRPLSELFTWTTTKKLGNAQAKPP